MHAISAWGALTITLSWECLVAQNVHAFDLTSFMGALVIAAGIIYMQEAGALLTDASWTIRKSSAGPSGPAALVQLQP